MRPTILQPRAVTATSSTMRTPFWRAPLASDCVMSEGLAWPSVGRNAAPTRSATSISGHSVLRLVGRKEMHLQAEAARRRRLPLDLRHAFGVAGEAQAAVHLPARRLSGLRLEPAIDLDRAREKPRDVGRCPQLPDEARRMEGGAARELLALEQQHILGAEFGEVIGGGAADDAAADDDDLRLRREIHHSSGSSSSANAVSNLTRCSLA